MILVRDWDMADKSGERVLGLATARFHQFGLFQGFRPLDRDVVAYLLDPAYLEYRPRREAETDPSFKQLIPYVILRHGNALFHYTRGADGTEARLRARRSVGVGGHITAADDAGAANPYRAGMLRELTEEVDIASPYRECMFGLINDDSTPVGSVHLGVVHVLDLARPDVRARETGIANAGFAPLAELLRCGEEFESWSRFAMEPMRDE
jgi:predicted NUDIX family phosphoesterase